MSESEAAQPLTTSNKYPRTFAALMKRLSLLERVQYLGVRVDPEEIYVQVNTVAFEVPASEYEPMNEYDLDEHIRYCLECALADDS